jgi:ubiquitin-conjugating enzyme E2 variant
MSEPATPGSQEGDLLEVAAIAAAVALLATMVFRLVRAANGFGEWLCVGIALPLGYPLADLATGIVHWAGDRIGDEDTPILGRRFIAPFRLHHVHPQEITQHGFASTNGHNAIAVIPVLATVYVAMPDPGAAGLFVTSLITSTATLGLLSNQFHKWAHAPQVPRLVRLFQRAQLILPPERHQLHHTPPFDRHYCITAGWMSEPLFRLGFFQGLDRLVAALSAGPPRRTRLLR